MKPKVKTTDIDVLRKVVLIFSIIPIFLILIISCTKKKVEEDPNVFYTCSMDPQVMEKKPGKCPICKMELTRTVVPPDQDKESVRLSETQIQLGNIATQKIGLNSIGEGINLRGTIVQDERKTNTISTRVSGRIERLYIKNPGETIKAGDHVYDIYSEELQVAINQYLLLKEKSQQLNGGAVNYSEMLKTAKSKLIVWGMNEGQISTLSKNSSSGLVPFYSKVNGVVREIKIAEGDYVNEGSSILEIVDYSTVWVEAEVYPQDMKAIKPGLPVKVMVEAFPNVSVEGKISFENPALEAQSRINLVRIELPNVEGKYKPGMRAIVTAMQKENSTITVPEEAVLFQPEMNIVWVQRENLVFVPKMIETGVMSNGFVEVKSGLKEGDVVVVSGAYLIDSEYRLRKGGAAMHGMDHGNAKEDSKPPAHVH